MAFLYDTLTQKEGERALHNTNVPDSIFNNLKFHPRPYQIEAFQRFIFYSTSNNRDKPIHLLYNMATGSGKTLIMAGLILYLYEKGYRNFLFFVNSNNIIQKTKDNFLHPETSKYLFSEKIVLDGKDVQIKEVGNFEDADENNINIKFTTIQQVHADLNNTKENSITYEDLKEKKIVLIADEAHHLNSKTKLEKSNLSKENLSESWEKTVIEILNQNRANLLLEFTATLDYEHKNILEKYQDKVIFKYSLTEFRKDRYSKEINLIYSLYDEENRIIQALLLNLYRQELAALNQINLKPVILFKAKRTVKESEQNKVYFHQLINNLSTKQIAKIRKTSKIDIVQNAFSFFKKKDISDAEIVHRTQINFKEENCLSANNDKEAEKNQILLNTLEDENNPIRAVFAVQKLNEGWDVLNLFDIVRLYESKSNQTAKANKTTLSEAQLIGRGARYYPFSLEKEQKNNSESKYKRKYDEDITNNLRVLETLYYHTKEDNYYIQALKNTLIESGIYEEEEKSKMSRQAANTEDQKKNATINKKKATNGNYPLTSFVELASKPILYKHALSSGEGNKQTIFQTVEKDSKPTNPDDKSKTQKLAEIPYHITRYALTQNPFFYFENLSHYFPKLTSISEFIESNDFLSGTKIRFHGSPQRLKAINPSDYLQALKGLLKEIEMKIKKREV